MSEFVKVWYDNITIGAYLWLFDRKTLAVRVEYRAGVWVSRD